MKIYTRTGDEGLTSLLGGSRVPKYHLRIEAYGTIDELNSYIGLLRDQQHPEELDALFIKLQDRLFTIGAELATEPGNQKVKIPRISSEDTEWLENEIDQMEEQLPPMKNFVLPGGHQAVSVCHIARCVCRRSERLVLHLSAESEVRTEITVFLNRLSDYLFVLSRWLTLKLGAKEVPWKPNR